ncbi:MAG TPA: hypothetical protein VMG62_05145 [Solirubrobacteraceae bacterium]|nr:hypothetical protein [Solirubrobacteraceae bacterium]
MALGAGLTDTRVIALLWRGRIVEAGDAERMFSSANPFVRQFLSGSAEGPLRMD